MKGLFFILLALLLGLVIYKKVIEPRLEESGDKDGAVK